MAKNDYLSLDEIADAPTPTYFSLDDAVGDPIKQDRTYLGAALQSGARSLAAAGATIIDSLNPFTLSEDDAAVLYKNDPEGFKKFQEKSASAVLQRFAAEQTKRAREVMQEVDPTETGLVSDKSVGQLEYATLDPDKAAYLSPTRVAGDVLQSLPTTLALALSGYFSRGKSIQAYEAALARETARGVPQIEAQALARAEAVREGAKSMAITSGISEGVVTGAQQYNQALDEVGQLSPEVLAQSPEYQALLEQGYDPATAKAVLANKVASQSGLISGATTGAISALGGRYLGGMIGEGGSLLPRIGKGALIEGLTEAPQSSLEQINQNMAMRRVDPSQSIFEGAGEAGVAGFVVGGVTGGGFGAAFGGPAEASRRRQLEAENKLKTSTNASDAASAADALAGSLGELTAEIDQYLAGRPPVLQTLDQTPAAPRLTAQQAADREAQLLAQANQSGTEFDRRMAMDQIASLRAQPQPGASTGFVDLTPMDEMQAQQRLTIMRDEAARTGGNALGLAIVPHPAQQGRFAIAEQSLPDLNLASNQTPISAQEAQMRIESAALAGQERARKAEDSPRQQMISRAMANIEARGGVASPMEAEILRQANMGQPYDRIDPALAQSTVAPNTTPRESFTGSLERANTESMAEQTARNQANQAQAQGQLDQQIEQTNQSAQLPDANDVIGALAIPGAQRSADQISLVNQAQSRFDPNDFSIVQRAATAPFQLSAPELVRLRELRNPSVASSATNVPDAGTNVPDVGLTGTRVIERLGQPTGGRIVTTGAKLSTKRSVAPGATVSIADGGTQHSIKIADPGSLGVQGRLLAQIARIFGKRVVAFDSDTLQADGFVMDDDNQSIFLNTKSQISPLAVFGHELTHLLKRDNPQAYAALQAVVEREMGEGAMDRFTQEYGEGANVEELTSDLVGNRFQEANFWQGVFDEIAAQNPEGARAIIIRLAAAVTKAINAFMRLVRQPGFQADQYVKDANEIKKAVRTALAAYAQSQKATAMQMEAEIAKAEPQVQMESAAAAEPARITASQEPAQSEEPVSREQRQRDAARAARQQMGETITASRVRPDQFKATAQDKVKAETYEERTGEMPYLSEGQIDVPLQGEGAKFSVKRPYGEKEFAKGRTNDPLTGLPLNKNGTVTLYFPTDNATARELARTKKLKASSPTSNRIYLTNESSGPKVANEPGNIEQALDGANVLIQVDPALLHLDQEFESGRKDFFIPIAEGKAFQSKMTKLFTLDAPRTKALTKDTKLTDLERRISDSIEEYLQLDGAARRERLKEARQVLKDEHNVGTLLGVNGKLEKTNTGGYGLNNYNGKDVMSMGLGLASAQKINEQNLSTCPKSAICEGLCLGETSGQNLLYGGEGQFKSGPRLAQYLKTEAMVQHPEDFAIVLHAEIEKFQRAASKEDYQPTVRLNVTSDFRPQTFDGIINAFPGVMFYDYTKLPTNSIAPNHHLTYSSTGASQVVDGETIVNKESNWDKMVEDRLMKGMNVAMAFTSRNDMPAYVLDERTGERFQVWNGDNYDARFLDPKPGQENNELNRGMIIGLTNKDKTTKPEEAAKVHNGFFLDYNPERDGDTLTIRNQKELAGGNRRTIPIAAARAEVVSEDASAADEVLSFSRRRKPDPEKTVTAYKLFRVDERKPGQLFPLFVNANEPVEMGVWLDADVGPSAPPTKTGKAQVKSKLGGLAMRPGWHAGDLPIATHIGGRPESRMDQETGTVKQLPTVRLANQVWAEVEMADDRDWQAEAYRRAKPYKNSNPKTGAVKDQPNPATAQIIDGIPEDGYYRYKTNPNMTGNWMIGGAIKVNRILSDAEVEQINSEAGVADLPREEPFDPARYGFSAQQATAPESMPKGLRQVVTNWMRDNNPFEDEGLYASNVKDVWLVGSRAKGTARSNSDYDVALIYSAAVRKDNEIDVSSIKLSEMLHQAYGSNMPEYKGQSVDIQIFFEDDAALADYSRVPLFSRRRNPQIDTPEFKRWFGDSKVVDENGDPLVMYHGTSDNFNAFDTSKERNRRGVGSQFISNPESASFYAGNDGNVMPVYLSVKNPYEVNLDVRGEEIDSQKTEDELSYGSYYPTSPIDWFADEGRDEIANLDRSEYDGYIVKGEGQTLVGVFNPTQIKSATGNQGTFDPANPDIRFSRQRTSPFYSQLAKAIDEVPARLETQPAQQWKAWLASNAAKLGVKKEEIEWTGINEYLDLRGKDKVTKAEIGEYLSANGVQVEETMLGKNLEGKFRIARDGEYLDAVYDTEEEAQDAMDDMVYEEAQGRGGYLDDNLDFVREAYEIIAADEVDTGEGTKYQQYVLPGGQEYKELLLTLPPKTDAVMEYQVNGAFPARGFKSEAEAREYIDNFEKMLDTLPQQTAQSMRETLSRNPFNINPFETKESRSKKFKSAHWEQPNVLAHIRFNERTDADGNRVLFIEEMQSDWAQEGRKRGFTDPKAKEKISALAKEYDVVAQRRKDLLESAKAMEYGPEFMATMEETSNLAVQMIELDNQMAELRTQSRSEIPAAPFVQDTKSWLALATKRMIAYAVDNGFDKVAFVNGQQSADRYDLSKKVETVAFINGEELIGAKENGSVVIREKVKPEQLEDYIGKDLARKLLDQPDQKNLSGQKYKELRGADLKVGGEGMISFYDRIVPQVVNDVLKKVGGNKLESTTLRTLDPSKLGLEFWSVKPEYSLDTNEYTLVDQNGDPVPGEKPTVSYDAAVERAIQLSQDFKTQQPAFTITDEMKAKVEQGLPLFSRRRNIFGQPAPLAAWTAPTESKFDDFIYKMQDKMVDTKRVVEALRKAVGTIDDKWNAYLQEELYHGRTAKATKDFLNNELRPLLQEMQMRKIDIPEFEEYLHNRHAEERNIQIAKINPALPDGGSGIDTQDARDYLANLDPNKRRQFDALARRIDAVTAGTRQLLVNSGLETQDTINTWEGTYKSYVPLQREDLDFSSQFTGMGTGQGYQVKGPASKRATGSKRAVVDILANVAMQRERAIVRAEKTRVAQAVFGLAVQNPNTDFWLAVDPAGEKDPAQAIKNLIDMGINPIDAQNLIKEPTQTYTDPKTGLVSQRVNPLLRNSPNVLAVRINGVEKYVFFNANDERSQRMVSALKNLDADQLGQVMGMAATVTRYFASVNTQYNPVFGVINFMRDMQGATLQLSTTPIADRKKEVLSNVIPALRGIYADVRAERKGRAAPGGVWSSLWEEFQREGGQTGYRDQFSRSAERAESLQRMLDPTSWMTSKLGKIFTANGKLAVPYEVARKTATPLFDWLADYNETMENAVRLAAYKAGKDKGLSNAQAASVAKNLTVNFNRKGQIATQAGALYAFFNAGVQGTTRLAQTLKGPAGKTIIGGGLLLGVMQAVLLSAAGFDEDEPPDFVKERNLIIPIGNGKYVSIPMPLGYNVIPNTSRVATEFVMSGFRDPAKRVGQMTGAFLEMFNPIGNAGWSVQTIAPTFADPIVALGENRDWTGKPIAKKDMSSTNPTPGYTRAKETASTLSKELAYYLNLATGGTKYKQGLLSPTPDQLDYLIGQVTGGVGREVMKAEQTVTSTVTGEELPPYKIPLAGRFYGDSKSASSESNRFYENITAINEHENEIKGRRKNREPMGDYMKDNPEARLYQYANQVERDVSELRQRRRDLVEKGASKESVKLIEQRITARMKQFNDRVRRLREQPSAD